MIVLNEKEYAERCLITGELDKKPYNTLLILGKYYYHCLGYRKKRIIDLLTLYLEKNYPRYRANVLAWTDTIERIALKAGKHPLYEISEIWITRSELDVIDKVDASDELKRLAFVMLCLAKLGNLKSAKNNGWVNTKTEDIFTLARISACKRRQREMLGDLNILGLVNCPVKIDNLSHRITFVDESEDSEKVIAISDFRELGYAYLKYKGENIIHCASCDILIRGNKNGTKKYCSACAGYVPVTEQKKIIACIDCGEEFEVNSKNNKTHRCASCQKKYRVDYQREIMREQRHKTE